MLDTLRTAVRSLRADTGFTFAAVLTLALGLGATTAVFSVVSGIVLNPLPYPSADRIVFLGWDFGAGGYALGAARGRIFRELIAESLVFSFLAAAVGVVSAVCSLDALLALAPWQLPRVQDVSLDARVLAFLRQAMVPVFAGLGAGLALAVVATRVLAATLFGLSADDPLTFAVAVVALAAAGLLASLAPGVRAARSAPSEALRLD